MQKIQIPPTLTQMERSAIQAEALLKQLANANRLMILCHLTTGEKTVGELSKLIDLSQSSMSQHLSKLKYFGLVDTERKGQTVCYRLCSMEAQALLSVLYLIYCKPTQNN